MNENYYNWLARKSEGEFIWCCADDVIFMIRAWDTIIHADIRRYLASKTDRILCVNVLDNTPAPGDPPGNKKEYPCFPMFSREVLDVLGCVLPPQLPTWGADKYTYSLFSQVNRMLFIHDKCYLNHVSYHKNYKKVTPDELTVRAGHLCAKYSAIDKHKPHKQGPYIQLQAMQLKQYMELERIKYA